MADLSNKAKNRFIAAMAREEEAREILSAIEDGGGVPDGGTTGQVLAKLSNADGDADWQDLSGVSVSSVNGQTGAVVITQTDVGLDQVDNTADIDKPISSATADALAEKQDLIIAQNNQWLYMNNSGVPEGMPDHYRNVNSGGLLYSTAQQPDGDTGGFDINATTINIEPQSDTPDQTIHISNRQFNIDPNSSGFDYGTGGQAVRFDINFVQHTGTSNIGAIEFVQNNFSIGNGSDPININGFGYFFGFGQFNSGVNVNGPIQGYGFQPNMADGSTMEVGNYWQAFYDNANIDADIPNYTSFNASPQIRAIVNNNNFTGVNINANIDEHQGNANYVGVGIYGNLGTFQDGGYAGIRINPTIAMTRNAVGLDISMDNVTVAPGSVGSVVIQDLTIASDLPGDQANSVSMQWTSGGTAGAEVVSNIGLAYSVQIENGVSTAQQIADALNAYTAFTLNLNVTITGTASAPQSTQGPVFLANGENPGQKRAALFDGDVEVTGALTFGGALSIGKLNAFATQAIADGGGAPATIHSLVSSPTVAANTTVANGDTLGLNTAMLLSMGDNSHVTTAFVGLSALALPAVISMGVGSTIDQVAGGTFAVSLDGAATGGTIDRLDLTRAIAIPNGTTAINNLRGFKFDLPFGDPGTKTWGFYEEPGVNNFMHGNLLIGGTAGSDDVVANASVAFEIKSTTKTLLNARMTSTQRDALTAIDGMVIYNTTTDKLQVRAGGTWVDLH